MDKRPWHQHPLPSQKANRSLRLPARVMLRDPEFASFTQVREAYGSFEAGYHLLQTAFFALQLGLLLPCLDTRVACRLVYSPHFNLRNQKGNVAWHNMMRRAERTAKPLP